MSDARGLDWQMSAPTWLDVVGSSRSRKPFAINLDIDASDVPEHVASKKGAALGNMNSQGLDMITRSSDERQNETRKHDALHYPTHIRAAVVLALILLVLAAPGFVTAPFRKQDDLLLSAFCCSTLSMALFIYVALMGQRVRKRVARRY